MSINFQFKMFFLFAFTMIMVNCTTTVVRIPSPLTESEKKNHGMVGVGLFAYNPEHSNGLFSSDNGATFAGVSATFSEVVSKDLKNGVVKISPYGIEEPVKLEEVDKVQYAESKIGYIQPFFVLLTLEPKKEYVVSNITYTYVVSCGNNCSKTVIRSFPLDPFKSYKALPISAKGGEIKFLGIHMGKVERTLNENVFGIPADNTSITEIFDTIKVAMHLEDAQELIKSRKENYLREYYYLGADPTKENAEKKFLDVVINAYQSVGGYWYELAQKKRSALK
ncbi:MAG: hypothetical protein GW938_02755 [Leptospira sp.]|jgi:hypothetical protein|nr:hypothetical protein [Leptospira sp.]